MEANLASDFGEGLRLRECIERERLFTDELVRTAIPSRMQRTRERPPTLVESLAQMRGSSIIPQAPRAIASAVTKI
jgi:hypothetical protein